MSGNSVNLISAIRGPIMLITIGVLFAIDHFGPYRIGITWPVILIVYGILRLAERRPGESPAAAVDQTKGSTL
ncbi:MAG: hypothetical protein LLG20_19985 [Acidobacteriales bacterium]|nr:hypothetical protein [Terriglobales bacterium]